MVNWARCENKKERVGYYLPSDLKSKIDTFAKCVGMSASRVVELILYEYINTEIPLKDKHQELNLNEDDGESKQ